MVNIIFKGILLGITVAFIIGPVFFALIQTSIYRGLRAGIQLAFGVMLSDLTLIILSFFGVLQLLNDAENYLFVGTIGGVLLIIFGIVTFIRKPKLNETKIDTNFNSNTKILKYVTKGYFLNILNPFLFIFWVTVMSMQGAVTDNDTFEIVLFFTAALITIFFTDVIKCLIAKWIKKFITIKLIVRLNKLVGLILMGFGLSLIYRVIFFF